jgi:hypothetical protein
MIRKLQGIGYFKPGDESTVAQRARLATSVAECAVGGYVAVSIDQMDCDCSRWTSSTILPAITIVVHEHIDRLYYDAEGPVYGVYITAPKDRVTRAGRDLALEAFENGHPYSIRNGI